MPPAVPFVSSQKDQLGFGAAARAIATPAYFNLAIDAEYNTETDVIRIFYNDAIVDFSPLVRDKAFFIFIAAGIPIPKYQEFPIYKMGLTFKGALKRKNEFPFTGNSFSGKGTMNIGDASSEAEHHGNFTIKVNKD